MESLQKDLGHVVHEPSKNTWESLEYLGDVDPLEYLDIRGRMPDMTRWCGCSSGLPGKVSIFKALWSTWTTNHQLRTFLALTVRSP